jgi:predicted nuclease with TOPRIM domain
MAEEKTAENVQEAEVSSTDEVQEEQSVVSEAEGVQTDNADELDKRIQRANKEAAKFRVEKNELADELTDLKQKLGQALGFVDEQDEKVEVDTLTKTVSDLQTENKMLKLQSVFNNVVEQAGGDKELTWAYLVASGKLVDVDIEAEDSVSIIQELVQTAFRIKPTLQTKTVAGVTASGTDISKEPIPLDIADQIKKLEEDGNFKDARALKIAKLMEL